MYLKAYSLLDTQNKRRINVLFLLMIIAASLEALGIGMMIPLINLLIDENFSKQFSLLNNFLLILQNLFNEEDVNKIFLYFFLIIYLFKNLFLIFFSYFQAHIILKIQFFMSLRLFEKYIFSPTLFLVQKHSSEIIRNATLQVDSYSVNFIQSALIILVEVITFLFIMTLVYLQLPLQTSIILLFFIGFGSVYYFFVRNTIYHSGKELTEGEALRIKSLQEAYASIKEIKIFALHKKFINYYIKLNLRIIKISKKLAIIRILPRHLIEFFSIAMIIIFLLILLNQNIRLNESIATIAVFAAVGFRIIPSMNRFMQSIQRLRFAKPVISNLYNELVNFDEIVKEKNKAKKESIITGVKKDIVLDNISFKYPQSEKYLFKNLNLKIKKGSSITIFGKTGSGKTALVEIISGLIPPSEGKVLVDDADIAKDINGWQKKISYVPQKIYLIDDTISNNITLSSSSGSQNLNQEKFNEVINLSKLNDLYSKGEFERIVGERGVRLSGGQIQKIGIARALFKETDLLIIDEGTVAIDSKSETDIISDILSLDHKPTIIFITHKTSLFKYFDLVYELNNGEMKLTNITS